MLKSKNLNGMKKLIGLMVVAGMIFSCSAPKKEFTPSYTKADFEKLVDGKQTTLFTLENEGGIIVTLTNYGAKIVSIFAPDKNGEMEDLVLGYTNIDNYVSGEAGFGAIVGPYANRIADAPVSYTHLRAHETRHDLVCR